MTLTNAEKSKKRMATDGDAASSFAAAAAGGGQSSGVQVGNNDNAHLTAEGDMPKKKFYRSRAHCNPLSFNEISYSMADEVPDLSLRFYLA